MRLHSSLIYLCLLLLCSCGTTQYTAHVLNYRSVDTQGKPVMLSGKVTIPHKQPKGVILLPHYTISANSEVPSNSAKGEQERLREDYVLIMPDYLGFGISSDRVHPYLRGDLTAQNCVDMLPVAQALLDSLNASVRCDSLTLVGFSQGGAAVLWILQLLETKYTDQYHVLRCFAGSGPYDVAVTYDQAIATNKVGLPLVIPMLVAGTSEAYGLNLKREQFFTPVLDEMYDEYIASKQYSVAKLFFRMTNHEVSNWLTGYGMDKTQPETRKMYEGFLRSSLVHVPTDSVGVGSEPICPEWKPKAPVYIFHSYEDNIVTYRCAEHLYHFWKDLPNVTFDFGNYGGHLRSAMTFMPIVKKKLAECYE